MARTVILLPELGIQTKSWIEIFVNAEGWEARPGALTHAVPPRRVIRRHHGIVGEIQEQSPLFQKYLDDVTAYDTSDYGHDLSVTLRLHPPPPYSPAQRRSIHVVLAKLALTVGAPLQFWSVPYIHAIDCSLQDTYAQLTGCIMAWRSDPDREALVLAQAIAGDDPPGRLTNAYRLLELVGGRFLDREIERSRYKRNVTARQFLALTKLYTVDLKTRLRDLSRRIRVDTEPQLRQLWSLLRPGESFSEQQVYDEITKFRNRHVHRPASEPQGPLLPWETPPFERITHQLLLLTISFVANCESHRENRTSI